MAKTVPIEQIHEFRSLVKNCPHVTHSDVRYGYFFLTWNPYGASASTSKQCSSLDEVRTVISEINDQFDTISKVGRIDPSFIPEANVKPIRTSPFKYKTESPPPYHFLLPGDEGYTDSKPKLDDLIVED